MNDCDVAQEIDELLGDIQELEQLIFEARARGQVRERLDTGWITDEMADNILNLFGEPCV